MSDRFTVAKEMAEKNGYNWDGLDEVMRNAYLHNADLVIAEREAVPVVVDGVKVVVVCKICQDKAFIGSKPCPECNPVGLSVDKVHPHMAAVEETGKPDPSEEELKALARKEAEEAKAKAQLEGVGKPRALKPSEYICSKCSQPPDIEIIHRANSGIGKKHQEFKA